MKMADKSVRRLSATESNEYHPRWSPDGSLLAFEATRRGLTDRETTMEDTHVWVMNADGSNRREVGAIDNRQGAPEWTSDGTALLFTVQDRGQVRLYRAAVAGGAPERIVNERGAVGSVSTAKNVVAYTFTSPSDLAQLYVTGGAGAAPQGDRPERRGPRRQAPCRGRVVHLRVERQQVRGRSVSDQADRAGVRGVRRRQPHEVPADRQHPRRPAAAGPGSCSRTRSTPHAAGPR
jgi:dipeptidyl aminopeptidase/acylaminoacyl peptidase